MNKEHLDEFMKELEDSIYSYKQLYNSCEGIANKNYFLGRTTAFNDIYNQIAYETNEYDIIELD